MREKELRLALVCYGGISLAVYMHGITKEVWRMVRASRAACPHGLEMQAREHVSGGDVSERLQPGVAVGSWVPGKYAELFDEREFGERLRNRFCLFHLPDRSV